GGGTFRIYAKMREWEETGRADGSAALDEWDRQQLGFRADWADAVQSFTLQGDAYQGETRHRGFVGPFEIPAAEVAGFNVLGRGTGRFSGGSDVRLQMYWDQSVRKEAILFSPQAEIFDVEFHHGIPLGRHGL